jgi:hypothetical protein
MTWNHRVIHKTETYEGFTEEKYYIGEVYYDESGNVTSYGEAFSPQGGNLEELKQDIERHLKACDHPVLHENELDKQIEYKVQTLPL